MKNLKNSYQSSYQIMNKLILSKYKQNINKFADSVSITPKNYLNKKYLDKTWKVYFHYYRDGKRTPYECRQYQLHDQIIQINRIKDHELKIEAIEFLKEAIIFRLKNQPKFVLKLIYGIDKAKELYPSLYFIETKEKQIVTIQKAFDDALKFKQDRKMSDSYISGLKSVKNRFLNHIGNNRHNTIELLDKKMLTGFLNDVTKGLSNRSYNNMKTNLSTLLTTIKDSGDINENYLESVKNLQTVKKINESFTPEEFNLINDTLKQENKILYYFWLHIYYGLMRPKTIVRLQVKHIDLNKMMFNTGTKTGNFMKIIVKPLYDKVYKDLDLLSADPEDYIFAGKKMIGTYRASEDSRRQYYTDMFRPYKKKLNISSHKTLYSARHNAIGSIFEKKAKELKDAGDSDYIKNACRFIMPFTNHKTIEQTMEYLRDHVKMVHVDWSGYL